MKAMLEANKKTPLKRFINVTYDKSEEVYEIPNYCKNELVCYDYPEMHCKNKLSLTRRFNGTLGSSNER